MKRSLVASVVLWAVWLTGIAPGEPPHPLLTWVKQHPRESAAKPSPKMGYETSYAYDPSLKLLIRYGGHNQGGGGEQNSEVWTYDLRRDAWKLKEPNDAPPGVCCCQQNVFDEALGKVVRFPSFSGSHGWQSFREIDLKDCSVWTYDAGRNFWLAMRPCPEPRIAPLRGAAWDRQSQVTVVHGGETAGYGTVVYDLYTNTWHEMHPDPAPESSVSQPGFTFDAVNRLFVLFGSQFHDDPRTWVYDLPKNAWRVLEVEEHPPADKSCPVLAADTRHGIVLCSVIGTDGPETWTLDAAKARWTRVRVPREPDPSGSRNRVLTYLPDENLFVLENRTKDEQQIWTFRYAEAPTPAAGPTELSVATTADGATLSWKAPAGFAAKYTVLRGEGKTPWEAEFQPVAKDVKETTYRDSRLKRGQVYYYQVRIADSLAKEEGASHRVRTQPPVVVELRAAAMNPRQVVLEWAAPDAEDIVGYHVERAEVSVYSAQETRRYHDRYPEASDLAVGRVKAIGPFRRLTEKPIDELRFTDESLDLNAGQKELQGEPLLDRPLHPEQFNPQGKKYRLATCAYRLVAVNRLGVESGPSPLVFTWPSAVQHVFSKEEGQLATRLKWQPNREASTVGYHVYRHEGRWNKDRITRRTAEPIQATEFLDEDSGEGTRRYEIVAVDRLGQEGEPSQPVWSRREWQHYYIPYTGEWHQ